MHILANQSGSPWLHWCIWAGMNKSDTLSSLISSYRARTTSYCELRRSSLATGSYYNPPDTDTSDILAEANAGILVEYSLLFIFIVP